MWECNPPKNIKLWYLQYYNYYILLKYLILFRNLQSTTHDATGKCDLGIKTPKADTIDVHKEVIQRRNFWLSMFSESPSKVTQQLYLLACTSQNLEMNTCKPSQMQLIGWGLRNWLSDSIPTPVKWVPKLLRLEYDSY